LRRDRGIDRERDCPSGEPIAQLGNAAAGTRRPSHSVPDGGLDDVMSSSVKSTGKIAPSDRRRS
jgi:hypothetical protein